jgi:hypothetical protein
VYVFAEKEGLKRSGTQCAWATLISYLYYIFIDRALYALAENMASKLW